MRDHDARALATEPAWGGTPSRHDLMTTIAEAECALQDLAGVREEVERLLATLGSA